MNLRVLFNVPNCICYLRLLLLLLSVQLHETTPELACWIFIANFALDGLDGAIARAMNQTSAFGAVLDVLVDNLSRGLLWVWAFPGLLGVLMVMLEMMTFAVTHKQGGGAWKDGCFRNAPAWVQAVMAKNFKTPLGCFAILGLMGAPLWLWAARAMPGTVYAHPGFGVVLLPGRLVSASVELWIVQRHMLALLDA